MPRWVRLFLIQLASLIIISLVGCTLLPGMDQSLENTQEAINTQQTQLSLQKLTATAQKADIATSEIQEQDSTHPPQVSSPGAPIEEATQNPIQPETPIPGDLDAMMKSAKILLYEDMIAYRDTNRYVKDTLDYMDLPYLDLGNATGDLKTQLTNQSPDGKGWDLVIVAAEAKPEVQGEFFTYLNDVLDRGTSVILEVWYLDQVALGTASSLLARCGVAFELDWEKIPPHGTIMFPLDPSHPILNQPNAGLSFTKSTGYWWDFIGPNVYDVGDLMKVVPGSNANLLLGISAQDPGIHGTLTVCVNDQLILQTFSSHILDFLIMRQLWENYIYNALRVRFEGGH